MRTRHGEKRNRPRRTARQFEKGGGFTGGHGVREQQYPRAAKLCSRKRNVHTGPFPTGGKGPAKTIAKQQNVTNVLM